MIVILDLDYVISIVYYECKLWIRGIANVLRQPLKLVLLCFDTLR